MSCEASTNPEENHDTCGADHFCFLPIGTETSRCVHCAFCSVLTIDCPSRCSCSSHDQCDPAYYCGVFDSDQNFCTPCEACQDRRRIPFDGATLCPDKCFCESSSQCAPGKHCQRQPPQSRVPEKKGLCISCASQIGCSEHLIVQKKNNENQTCQQLCPDDFECNQHSDCNEAGSWCSQNHQCQNCSQACWTEQRLVEQDVHITCDKSDCNSTAILEQQTSNIRLNEWTQFPYISIDYSCPEACCDWGMQRAANSKATVFTVGPCNSAINVHGAWYEGIQLDWNIPQDFVSASNPCQRMQYEFAEGFPPIVYQIICDEVIPACQSENRTLALFVTNDTHTVYADESFPFVESYDDTGFMCALKVAAVDMSIAFFISLSVLACLFSSIIFYLSRRPKKPWERQWGDGQALFANTSKQVIFYYIIIFTHGTTQQSPA